MLFQSLFISLSVLFASSKTPFASFTVSSAQESVLLTVSIFFFVSKVFSTIVSFTCLAESIVSLYPFKKSSFQVAEVAVLSIFVLKTLIFSLIVFVPIKEPILSETPGARNTNTI
jgi:hypothetical protein